MHAPNVSKGSEEGRIPISEPEISLLHLCCRFTTPENSLLHHMTHTNRQRPMSSLVWMEIRIPTNLRGLHTMQIWYLVVPIQYSSNRFEEVPSEIGRRPLPSLPPIYWPPQPALPPTQPVSPPPQPTPGANTTNAHVTQQPPRERRDSILSIAGNFNPQESL